MKNCFYISTLLSLFVFCISCQGQESTQSPKNGISNNSSSFGPTSITRKIKQDKEGNVLLAAYEGIIRYDGNTFTNLSKNIGLDTCYAFDVIEDKNGNIWIASTLAGAYRFNEQSFTHFTTKEGLAHNRTIDVLEDRKGNIWFATMGGISCYNGKTFRNFTTKEGLPHDDVSCILEDKKGNLWFGTRGITCVYDGETFTQLTNEEGVPFEGIVSIIEDKNGSIWLGGKDGLWRYNPNMDPNSNRGAFMNFTTTGVSCVYEDKKGNIWTNTNGWINKDQPNPHTWVLSRYDEKSLANDNITATTIRTEKGMFFGILEDQEGSIWVGTLDGVFRYNNKSFNHFKNNTDND